MSGALVDVAELVRRETGMVVKEAQLPALEAAIDRVAPGIGAERLAGELSGPSGGPLLHRLVDEVTVQETYFFRELRELQSIDWRGLLDEAREAGFGVVRVWVAACSTGEEAYSMAILASEAFGSESPPVTILATDLSNAALRRAEAGTGYSERSVRNLPLPLRQRYLIPEADGSHGVKDSLRSLVRFRHHNLVAGPSPPLGEVAFDVIACRNVLIYFDLSTVRRVLDSLEAGLRPSGQLILGAADRLTGTASNLDREAAPVERRRRRSRKRALRRPLGLEPRPGEARAPRAPRLPGGGNAGEAGAKSGAPRRRAEDRIEDALLAADAGDLVAALATVQALLAENPLLPDAYFVRGLVELEQGDAAAAVSSLRRTLYLDPSFGLAAFELGRAHDASHNPKAAQRAYRQALRSLDAEDDRHRAILDQIDLGDVAAACAARLQSDRGAGS